MNLNEDVRLENGKKGYHRDFIDNLVLLVHSGKGLHLWDCLQHCRVEGMHPGPSRVAHKGTCERQQSEVYLYSVESSLLRSFGRRRVVAIAIGKGVPGLWSS